MFNKSSKVVIICAFNLWLLTFCQAKKEQQQQQRSPQEIWEQDLTDTFKIEGSDQGIQKVNLKCGSDSMHVMLETEKPFTGVMYTRGSFYKQAAPCFVKPSTNTAKTLEMNFNLDQCQTQKEGELYSNIVVIQNDPELITPGDSAFSLECDFRQPRSVDVEANMQTRDRMVYASKITLTSPDPSQATQKQNTLHNTITSDTETVTYIPKHKKSTAKPKNTKPKLKANKISHYDNDHDLEDEKTLHLGTVEDVTHLYSNPRKEEL
ncbi:hypothetical protein FF38_12952 [Lucilia cuprina]|uniref:ZP domain-containing protein n=1 Tax=Lucilia cuprina TaxID=7375 RepID=A0A0L0C026_LUCCU|nr:hypothetical protein CVS40_0965 [Lucilia cuprina]KNC25586.1 hypothetical protein FF38_12952 [Lucilia cuprina]